MLPFDLYPRLIAAAGSGAAIAESEDRKQPLCSVWPLSALPLLEEELTGGRHPATWMMLERLNASVVKFHSAAAFANINTRIDLSVLAGRLEEEASRPTYRPPEEDCVPHFHR